MATFTELLITRYAQTKARNPKLRKGQFMQQAYPNRYKNEESAYQAFNQTTKGRRTGKRLAKISEERTPGAGVAPTLGKRKKKYTGPPGASRAGLWKINVHFVYIDEDGQETEEVRSFIAESAQYTSLLDIPIIQEIIIASVDDYIIYWIENDSLRGNYTSKWVEVYPIYTFQSQNVVDLDTIEELVIE